LGNPKDRKDPRDLNLKLCATLKYRKNTDKNMRNSILQGILRRTRYGSGILFAGSGIAQLLDLASTIILAHYLGLKVYGVLVAARAVSGIVSCLLSARSSELLLAYLPRFERNKLQGKSSGIYTLCIGIELSLGLLGLAICAALASILPIVLPESRGFSFLILPFAFSRHWGNSLISNNQALLRLRERYWSSATQGLLAPMYRLLGLSLAVALGKGLAVCVFVDGAAALASWLTGGLLLRLTEGLKLSLRSIRELRDHGSSIWTFLRLNWAAASAKTLAGYGAEMMLVVLASAESVGAFGLARRLAAVLVLTVDPLIQTATPEIYRLAADQDYQTLRRFVTTITGYSLLVLPALNILVITFREQLTAFVGGSEFTAASGPLVFLAIAFSVHISMGWLRPLMLALHQPKIVLGAQFVMGLVVVSMSWVLIPKMGATGAALATLMGYLGQIAFGTVAIGSFLSRTDQE